jgi:predicted metal-dependent enzyme (double-stranded beta helix superfamily)
MFDKDRFIADCREALDTAHPAREVREIVARAVSDPVSVLQALGEPGKGTIGTICRSADLTILNVVWPPHMVVMPHEHAVWAVIGIYSGREDNTLWRRLPGDADGRIEAAGAKSLSQGESLTLGPDAVHSVVNPLQRQTLALHVYGGDFFAQERSEWDPESLREKPYDMEKLLRSFAR